MKRLFLFSILNREKFSPSRVGASVDETTIAPYAIEEKISPSRVGALVNETTISLLSMGKGKIFTIPRESFSQ